MACPLRELIQNVHVDIHTCQRDRKPKSCPSGAPSTCYETKGSLNSLSHCAVCSWHLKHFMIHNRKLLLSFVDLVIITIPTLEEGNMDLTKLINYMEILPPQPRGTSTRLGGYLFSWFPILTLCCHSFAKSCYLSRLMWACRTLGPASDPL